MPEYDPQRIELKWQKIWDGQGEFRGRESWSLVKRRISFPIGFVEMRWKSCVYFTQRGSGPGNFEIGKAWECAPLPVLKKRVSRKQ